MRVFIIMGILLSYIYADEESSILQFNGISTSYKEKEIFIKRIKHPKCLQVGVTPENIFGGDLAGRSVPAECKKTFVTSLGVVQPIKIDEKIATVGEIEVLKFLQLMDFEPEKYILVDARSKKWFTKIAIPHAVNIPFLHIKYHEDYLEDLEETLKPLHVTKNKKGDLDFSQAKKVIVYCNGSWCTQSAKMIKELVSLGYPKEKLFWYRGGLQDWIGAGFTVTKGK